MNVTVTALFYNSTLWLSEICCTVQTLSCRLVFQKGEKLGHNLQCYMFIHPPGADSLCSLLFSQLLSHCVEDYLQKGKRNIYWISWYHSKQTILFIICQSICQSFKSFHISPFPPGQPKCKCPGGYLRVACGKDDKVLNWWHMTVCKILNDTIVLQSQIYAHAHELIPMRALFMI